jgi:DNA-directed RNA polymerase specialized sigma subunit
MPLHPLRMPRRLQALRVALAGADRILTSSLGRSPTVADMSAHLQVSEEDVIECLEADHPSGVMRTARRSRSFGSKRCPRVRILR